MEVKEKEKRREQSFTKEQLLSADRFRDRRDVLGAILDSKKTYTIEQVNAAINKFMKGKVK